MAQSGRAKGTNGPYVVGSNPIRAKSLVRWLNGERRPNGASRVGSIPTRTRRPGKGKPNPTNTSTTNPHSLLTNKNRPEGTIRSNLVGTLKDW